MFESYGTHDLDWLEQVQCWGGMEIVEAVVEDIAVAVAGGCEKVLDVDEEVIESAVGLCELQVETC